MKIKEKSQYIPFTWEDAPCLLGRVFRFKGDSSLFVIDHVSECMAFDHMFKNRELLTIKDGKIIEVKPFGKLKWIEVKKETHPIKNCIWVECIAEIRKNDTGEIREYETEEILEIGDEHPSVFNWEENNYSCDCNRLLFFNRAKGEEREEDWDVECTIGKFSVNLKNKKDGKVYYREYGA